MNLCFASVAFRLVVFWEIHGYSEAIPGRLICIIEWCVYRHLAPYHEWLLPRTIGPYINDVIIGEGRGVSEKLTFLMTLGARKGQTGGRGEGKGEGKGEGG